jgi:hypothetical protein
MMIVVDVADADAVNAQKYVSGVSLIGSKGSRAVLDIADKNGDLENEVE